MIDKKLFKRGLKKNPQELQEYLAFKRKGFVLPAKKGKGSFKRKSKYNEGEKDIW